mmetsp:Transcript_25621/g.59311  ORF Transcript_25621/g.59311 Transcript_25621/m.59311 type:complete len:232 (-) Transcript_25621:178-873(-)
MDASCTAQSLSCQVRTQAGMPCRAASCGQRSEGSWLRSCNPRACWQGPIPRDEHEGHKLHGALLGDVHIRPSLADCRLGARDFSLVGRGTLCWLGVLLGRLGAEAVERDASDLAFDLLNRRDGAAARGSLTANVVAEEGAGLRELAPARSDFYLQAVAIGPHDRGLLPQRTHVRNEHQQIVLARAALQVAAAAVPVVLGAVPVPAARVLRARQQRQQTVPILCRRRWRRWL